jgi:serine/threonine protein kinase
LERVEELFHQAVELPTERRAAFLDRECGNDRDLRQAVDELLRHDQVNHETDSFLNSPLKNAAAQLRPTLPAMPEVVETPNIPGYEILGDLGRGGMGVVFKARQLNLNRIVALKMLLQSEAAGPQQIKRFKNETELLARLQHPNIIPIYDVGTQDGRPYFTMEFVDGPSLAKFQGSRPAPPTEAANLIEILARAMHVVHQHGIVHRDLKPSNILLQLPGNSDPNGGGTPSDLATTIPKITDFGVAKDVAGAKDLTKTGVAMGTPSYMAPEQARGRSADIGPAADIYSLGAILYELLTGRPPFDAATSAEIIAHLLNDPPLPPSRFVPGVPRDLTTICLKCLEKNPEQRYSSMWDLAEDLRRFQADEPIRARPIGWIERTRRWYRRHPLAGSLATLLGFLAIAFATTVTIYDWQLRKALNLVTELADQERKQIVQLNVIIGNREQESGDLFTAALRFAEALRLDDRDREQQHRDRLAAVLQQCPRLTEIIHLDRTILCCRATTAGILVASVDADNRLEVRNVTFGSLVGQPIPMTGLPGHAALSENGQWLVGVMPNGTTQVWNVIDGKVVDLPATDVRSATFAPTGPVLITHHADGRLQTWDLASGQPTARPVADAVRGPTKGHVDFWHVSFDAEGFGQLTDVLTGATKKTAKLGSDAQRVAISPTGDHAVVIGQDHRVSLWHTAVTALTPVVHGLEKEIGHLRFAADGRHLLLMDVHGTVRVWDTATGQAATPPIRNPGGLAAAEFHPDGRHVVLVKATGEIRVWQLSRGTDEPASPWDIHVHKQSIEQLLSMLQVHAHCRIDEQQHVTAVDAQRMKELTKPKK